MSFICDTNVRECGILKENLGVIVNFEVNVRECRSLYFSCINRDNMV